MRVGHLVAAIVAAVSPMGISSAAAQSDTLIPFYLTGQATRVDYNTECINGSCTSPQTTSTVQFQFNWGVDPSQFYGGSYTYASCYQQNCRGVLDTFFFTIQAVPDQNGQYIGLDFSQSEGTYPTDTPCDQYTVMGSCQTVGWYEIASNFSAVSLLPEPTTWAMMLIGFAAIGIAMRGRRRAQGQPTAATDRKSLSGAHHA